MEFHFGLWIGVSALYSESGRQLGEENARPFPLNHHLPAETIACKYSGSRAGKRINMSALRTAMQNFEEALAVTGAVRQWHLSHVGNMKQPGLWDLYIIARASIALVAYQRRFSRQRPKSRRVSDVLTSQYQFISGVFMICRHMMENADTVISENRLVTPELLYNYADEHRVFISFNDMGCAGSKNKIYEFLEFCNAGDEAIEADITLSGIVTNPENWYRYALATVELDCFVETERALRHRNSAFGEGVDPEKIAGIYRSVQAYCRRLMDCDLASSDGSSDDFAEQALARQNHILNLLERPRIVEIPARHIENRLGAPDRD